MEENELQVVLNDILSDKNKNLIPKHLKAGVTCLGVEGDFDFVDTDDYGVCNEIAGQITGELNPDTNPDIVVENIINIRTSRISVNDTTLVIG